MQKCKVDNFKHNPYIGLMHDSELPVLNRLPEPNISFNSDCPYVGYIFHTMLFPFNIIYGAHMVASTQTTSNTTSRSTQTDTDKAMEIGDEMLKQIS